MENKLEVVENKENEVVIKETKTYTATKQDIERELQNIKFNKENLIESSKHLAKDFERLTQREKELQQALSQMISIEKVEEVKPIME